MRPAEHLRIDPSARQRIGSPSQDVAPVRAALDEAGGQATLEDLAAATGLRSDRVAAALALLEAGGVVTVDAARFSLT